jgi:hypothetical protein
MKGLCVSLRSLKKVYTEREKPVFEAILKNVSDTPHMLYGVYNIHTQDRMFTLEIQPDNGKPVTWKNPLFKSVISIPKSARKNPAGKPRGRILHPGNTLRIKSNVHSYNKLAFVKGSTPISAFPKGKYAVRLILKISESPKAHLEDSQFGYWQGTIVTKCVKFEVE